ncbi:MAG: hypothetical protein K6G57_00150 [Lachnospiraceae bacterium]|nr:hypothetical protein [Lachnospiraceae bacterium]
MRKVLCGIICIILLLNLCSCGKGDSAESRRERGQTVTSDGTTDAPKDVDETDDEIEIPFIITVTDKDKIYVDVKKSFFTPGPSAQNKFIYFDSSDGKTATLTLLAVGDDETQCSFSYGESGDTKTTAVSDYTYEDNGNAIRYTIELNNPDRHISGGDNLSIPNSVFDNLVSCKTLNEEDYYVEYPIDRVLIMMVDRDREAKKEAGLEKIFGMLLSTDPDNEYLKPSSDDFRVDIFEIPDARIYDQTVAIRPAGGPLLFGTDFRRNPVEVSCKMYRVYEYGPHGTLIAYSEKVEFESESDALHVFGANAHDEFSYCFLEETGYDRIPDDFTDEFGLSEICDRIMPEGLKAKAASEGYDLVLKRESNIYYLKCDNWTCAPSTAYLENIGENYLIMQSLYARGTEFSADNADKEGFIHLESEGTKATVFYSKPEAHTHNISSGSDEGYPDDFVQMADDDKYFSPATDDYILFYSMYEGYGDEPYNMRALIVSFDINGKVTDAKYRLYRSSNMVNPMSELIEDVLRSEGVSLITNDDNVAYFDVTKSDCMKKDGEIYNKTDLIEDSIDEDSINMPMYGWSAENGMYISKG